MQDRMERALTSYGARTVAPPPLPRFKNRWVEVTWTFHSITVEISRISTVDATGSLNITLAKYALSVAPTIWNIAYEVVSVHAKQARTLAPDAIEGIKKAFGLASTWTSDPCLALPYDWLTCSKSPPRVTEIKLTSANLSGPFPDLRALASLDTLHLQNNSLTCAIPEWLAHLPNLQKLYLQNNYLSRNVPKGLLTLKSLRLEGNHCLFLNTTCASDGMKSSLGLIVDVVVGVLLAVRTLLGIVVCICCRRHAKPNKSNPSLHSQSGVGEQKRDFLLDWETWLEITLKSAQGTPKKPFQLPLGVVDIDIDEAMRRVERRHVAIGEAPDYVKQRVVYNDRPNAELIALTKKNADLIIPSIFVPC